jgi:hypothetical protein
MPSSQSLHCLLSQELALLVELLPSPPLLPTFHFFFLAAGSCDPPISASQVLDCRCEALCPALVLSLYQRRKPLMDHGSPSVADGQALKRVWKVLSSD